MLRKVNVHQCEGKAFPFRVKAFKRKPRKSGENQPPALSGGKKRKTRSNDFSESLESTSLRPTQTCESRAGERRTGPQQSFTSQNHSAPVLERGRLAASLPPFKSGTGLAPLREKTSLGQRRDPGAENRAGLPRRCRPALARTSRSNSSECQAAAAGLGEPPSPGGRASGGVLPLCRCAPGVLRGWAGGQRPAKDLLGKRQPLCLYLSPRSGAAEPLSAAGGPSAQSALASRTPSWASAPRSRQSFIHSPAGRRGRGAGARLMWQAPRKYRPGTANVCACAPWPAFSRHLHPAGAGMRRAGGATGRRKRRRRGFRVRNRSRSALLAAIFNEDWAGPNPVLGVPIAFEKEMLH